MIRRARIAIVVAALSLAACQKQDDDIKDLPGPNGLLPDGSPPRQEAPRPPDPGTYSGVNPKSRPPLSGLNADPSNPNGAPGSSH